MLCFMCFFVSLFLCFFFFVFLTTNIGSLRTHKSFKKYFKTFPPFRANHRVNTRIVNFNRQQNWKINYFNFVDCIQTLQNYFLFPTKKCWISLKKQKSRVNEEKLNFIFELLLAFWVSSLVGALPAYYKWPKE